MDDYEKSNFIYDSSEKEKKKQMHFKNIQLKKIVKNLVYNKNIFILKKSIFSKT